MGRRKIEIQPITHERNRSVTFLKRKNGLFKKAYELGVLCSVDVAVIIFEERPGHHLKLYQYCSSDIHDIVQRHIRHEGEKDTRGPADFSGNASTKLDDIGEGDDDDLDDEDDLPRKRRNDGKLKPNDPGNDMEYLPHRMSIPQPPMNIHGMPPSGGPSSTHPVSNDRHSALRGGGLPHHSSHHHHLHSSNKKPRLGNSGGLHPSHSRSPSDDAITPGSGGGQYPYQGSNQFTRHGQYQHHPSSHHTNPQYTPFFPVSTHTPPPSFIPLQSDFPPPNSSRGAHAPPHPRGSGGPGFPPPRTGSSNSSYDSANIYPNMIRPGHSNSHHGGGGGGGGSNGGGGGPGGGGANGDLFAAFLDADEHHQHTLRQTQNHNGPNFGLEWPVHNPGNTSTAGSSSSVSNPSAPSSTGPESSNNWLDFLSGNPAAANNNAARESGMSWERGGDRGDIAEIFAGSENGRSGSARGSVSDSPLVVGMNVMGKRPRGSDVDENSHLSPPMALNGRDDGKKDLKGESGG